MLIVYKSKYFVIKATGYGNYIMFGKGKGGTSLLRINLTERIVLLDIRTRIHYNLLLIYLKSVKQNL